MTRTTLYVFTYGDLANVNILTKQGCLIGIVGWEISGYFPALSKLTCAGIGSRQEDKEWNNLLRECMSKNMGGARDFCLDFYALSKYTNLGARRKQLLSGLEPQYVEFWSKIPSTLIVWCSRMRPWRRSHGRAISRRSLDAAISWKLGEVIVKVSFMLPRRGTSE